MKIRLPNPSDYESNIDAFFEQLELSVYHAQKSWEKIKKNLSEEELLDENERPYLLYRLPFLEENYDKYSEILDGLKHQEIEIEITTP